MTKYFVIAIVILGLVLTGGVAQAETCNFTEGATSNWTDELNWSCGHVPTSDDLAVIKSGNTCQMDIYPGNADSLTVESTATLNIEVSKTLQLDGTDNTTIDGTVNLLGCNSVLAFVADNNYTIDGSGKIVGQHYQAQIAGPGDIDTLTSEITIEGMLRIVGDGTFVNAGTIHANAAGALHMGTYTLDDQSGALWKISTNSSAILKFEHQLGDPVKPLLDGDFVIEVGKLDMISTGFHTVGFDTTGSLDWTGGTIAVAEGGTCVFGYVPTP